MNNELLKLIKVQEIENNIASAVRVRCEEIQEMPEMQAYLKFCSEKKEKTKRLDDDILQLKLKSGVLSDKYERDYYRSTELSSTDLEPLSDEVLAEINQELEDLLKSFEVIENELIELNKCVFLLSKEYLQAVQEENEAKELYYAEMDKRIKKDEDDLIRMKTESIQLLGEVEDKKRDVYLELRANDIFPAIIEYNGKKCSVCKKALNKQSLDVFAQKNYTRCNHCGRIIYSNKD